MRKIKEIIYCIIADVTMLRFTSMMLKEHKRHLKGKSKIPMSDEQWVSCLNNLAKGCEKRAMRCNIFDIEENI